jgi:hypothetical protein
MLSCLKGWGLVLVVMADNVKLSEGLGTSISCNG